MNVQLGAFNQEKALVEASSVITNLGWTFVSSFSPGARGGTGQGNADKMTRAEAATSGHQAARRLN